MQIAVKHNLQIFEGLSSLDEIPDDTSAIVLPMGEAVAVMGETVAAFLARVAWRFDLPTICRINGECYGRDEWETRALATNDNLEFITRPLGSGSGSNTVKSIGAIVAMLALTAVAGPAGPLGAALAGSLGSFGGALASAVIVGAGAVPIAAWLAPKLPWWRRAFRVARDNFRAIVALASRYGSQTR